MEFYILQAVPKTKCTRVLAELAWRRIYLTNESCSLLKHAAVPVHRQLQSSEREHPPIKSSSELIGGFVYFLTQSLSRILLRGNESWQEAGMAVPRVPLCRHRAAARPVHCAEGRGRERDHQHSAASPRTHRARATPQSAHGTRSAEPRLWGPLISWLAPELFLTSQLYKKHF